MPSLRLSALNSGESAHVAGVVSSAPAAKRLADLGFVPGAVVRMLRAGAPCIVQVDQTRLALGKPLQYSVRLAEGVRTP